MWSNGVLIVLALSCVLSCTLAGGEAMAAERKTVNQLRPEITGIQSPVGMIYDKDGALYVAEWGAGRVSRFDATGRRATVTDSIRSPAGLAFDDNGILYAASYGDGSVYALEKGKEPRRVASGFAAPTGLLWSRDKGLLVANRNAGEVIRLHPDGTKEVLSRNHKTPVGLARTADGSIFVSCYGGSVDRIAPDGRTSTVYTGLSTPGVGIIADGPDRVLVVDYGGSIVARVDAQGKASTVADGLRSPVALVRMPDGRLLVGTWADNAAFAFDIQ